MRIEDYWEDKVIYEAEWIEEIESQETNFSCYFFCDYSMDKKTIKKKFEQKTICHPRLGEFIGINEVCDALITREIADKKEQEPMSVFSAIFTVTFKEIYRKIERNLIFPSKISEDQLYKEVQQKFSNVINVENIQKLYIIMEIK